MEVSISNILRMETVEGRPDDSFDHWIVYHFVWCTRGVKPLLVGETARECGEVLVVYCRERSWDILYLLIRPDHVRISLRVSPRDAPSDVARYLKSHSAQLLRLAVPGLQRQAGIWTRPFYCSTSSIGDIQARLYLRHASG